MIYISYDVTRHIFKIFSSSKEGEVRFEVCTSHSPAFRYLCSQYVGKWYEIEKYFAFFEFGGKCVTAIYSEGENSAINILNKQISALWVNDSINSFNRINRRSVPLCVVKYLGPEFRRALKGLGNRLLRSKRRNWSLRSQLCLFRWMRLTGFSTPIIPAILSCGVVPTLACSGKWFEKKSCSRSIFFLSFLFFRVIIYNFNTLSVSAWGTFGFWRGNRSHRYPCWRKLIKYWIRII